jgi:hypothetical protein
MERAASRSSANALTAGKGKDVTSLCVDLGVTFAPATAGHSLPHDPIFGRIRNGIKLYKVPEFLYSRLNWVPQPLPRKRVYLFPMDPGGGGGGNTLAWWGLGEGIQFRRLDRNSGTLYCITPLRRIHPPQ